MVRAPVKPPEVCGASPGVAQADAELATSRVGSGPFNCSEPAQVLTTAAQVAPVTLPAQPSLFYPP